MSAKFSDKAVADKFSMVIYLTSEENGVPTYFYLVVKGNEFANFKDQLAKNAININDWNIVKSGYGSPSFEVKNDMYENYGCNSDNSIQILSSRL